MYSSQIATHQPLWERNEPAYIAAAVPNTTLELGALQCPLLGLKSMKALKSLDPGQTIEISTTGASAKRALKRVAWMTGAELLDIREEDQHFVHVLTKS